MSLIRVVALSVAGALVAAPVWAQGIPARRGTARVVQNAPRMLVANPYVFNQADSAAAVQVGRGMRDRMQSLVGRDFFVIPDTQMNQALVQYGYPRDAILSPLLARTLATNIQGRFLVTTTMNRDSAGRYHAVSRLGGVNDDAGVTRTHVSAPGQKPEDFGKAVAGEFDAAVEALEDARDCVSNMQQKPADAAKAAAKALEKVPDHGLAAYCLAQLAIAQKAPRDSVVKLLQMAVKGDSLSLPAWTLLAQQYQAAEDTARMFYAFENMLRIAPTNQKLREELLRVFLNAGEIERAKRVADEGLRIDPYNAELYDLKSNVCLFASDFRCAVSALEQAYTVDSTRADTLFFAKIGIAAEQRLADTLPPAETADTANYLKWAKIGVQRYPENLTLLQNLAEAYAMTGQTDSSVAVLQRIYPLADSTAVKTALASLQGLIEANKFDSTAAPYLEFVQQRGDSTQKDLMAGLFLNAATPYLQKENLDYQKAADLSRVAAQNALAGGRFHAPANFVLGVSAFQLAAAMDSQTEKQKSCEMAREENELLQEARTGLTAGQSFRPDAVQQYLGYLDQFDKRVASMIKAYCR